MGKISTYVGRRGRRSRLAATMVAAGALLLSSGFVVMGSAGSASAVGNDKQCLANEGYSVDHKSSVSAAFGTLTWSGNDDKTLAYDIKDGYQVELCIKNSNGHTLRTLTGPTSSTDDGVISLAHGISHIDYKVTNVCPSGTDREGEPVGDEPCNDPDPDPTVVTPRVDFVQPTCEDPSAGATAYVGGVLDATENQLEGGNDTADNGVTFAITSGGIGKGKSVTITATAAPGFVFAGGETTKTFTYDFDDAPTDCGGGGPTLVAPSVDFDDPTCADLTGSDVDVVEKTGVAYTLTGTPGLGQTVSVLAQAQPGFVFAGGAKSLTFEHTFPSIEDLDCVAGTESIRPAVEFTEASCEAPDGAGFTGMFTDVVDYAVSGDVAPGASVVVTATIKAEAADQFAFPAGFDNTFEHTFVEFDESECIEGTQTSKPRPEGERPPTVLGTSTAVPTAVDAGLTGGPTAGGGSTTALLAQLMVGAGLLLLLAGGWTGLGGRRTRGVHQV